MSRSASPRRKVESRTAGTSICSGDSTRARIVLFRSGEPSVEVKNVERRLAVADGGLVHLDAGQAVRLHVARQQREVARIGLEAHDSRLGIEPLEVERGHPDVGAGVDDERLRRLRFEEVGARHEDLVEEEAEDDGVLERHLEAHQLGFVGVVRQHGQRRGARPTASACTSAGRGESLRSRRPAKCEPTRALMRCCSMRAVLIHRAGGIPRTSQGSIAPPAARCELSGERGVSVGQRSTQIELAQADEAAG